LRNGRLFCFVSPKIHCSHNKIVVYLQISCHPIYLFCPHITLHIKMCEVETNAKIRNPVHSGQNTGETTRNPMK
jgi:hypothetical protein